MHLETRVLVTGGAGFLGSHLCERLLADGGNIICVDNFFTGAKCNIDHLLDHHRFELIRHDVTFRSVDAGANNQRTRSRRNACLRNSKSVHPQVEDYWGHVNPIGPRSCYDEGKRCAETLFFDYWRQHRLSIKVARIFNTYGPRMHPNDGRVVSNFISQALLGRDITIYGDGTQTRSFCYVDDLIDGLVRLMATRAEVTGPVNIGNPSEFSMLELAKMVIDLTGSHSRIVHRPRPEDDPQQRRPDILRAQELLDWKPRTMLKDGLARTIAYFDQLLSDQKLRAQLITEPSA